mmetsp:Transcript_16460/g.45950  ORF Transcript_16460/g.45950 Transcript_16460/m.45950 type:complete len:252 (+) Transcript_16460:267-1022(+)
MSRSKDISLWPMYFSKFFLSNSIAGRLESRISRRRSSLASSVKSSFLSTVRTAVRIVCMTSASRWLLILPCSSPFCSTMLTSVPTCAPASIATSSRSFSTPFKDATWPSSTLTLPCSLSFSAENSLALARSMLSWPRMPPREFSLHFCTMISGPNASRRTEAVVTTQPVVMSIVTSAATMAPTAMTFRRLIRRLSTNESVPCPLITVSPRSSRSYGLSPMELRNALAFRPSCMSCSCDGMVLVLVLLVLLV